jgi:hypothetical protein
VPVGAQPDWLADGEKEVPLVILEAKEEIFFLTRLAPQRGQVIWSLASALRSSSSNDSPHASHTNSKMGISSPRDIDWQTWEP